MKKIIFLDVDGTLTNDEKVIMPKTKEALIRAQKDGHTVVLASGRPDSGMKFLADELEMDKYNGYLLAFNGGKVINWTTKEIIFQQTMPRELIKPILEYVNENDLGLMTYDSEKIVYGTRMDEYIEHESFINRIPMERVNMLDYPDFDPNKCLATANPEIAQEHEKKLAKLLEGKISVYRSAPFFIEIVPEGIDKAASIERLIDCLGMTKEQTIAFGDGFNDLSMIEYAGIGVAMGNAQDVVKELADIVTETNNDEGIARTIEQLYEKGIL